MHLLGRLRVVEPFHPTQLRSLYIYKNTTTVLVSTITYYIYLYTSCDYVCAMCFWEHVEMFVIVSGAAIWVYATNYLTIKPAQEG